MSDYNNRKGKPMHSPITSSKDTKRTSFRKRSETAPIWDDIPAHQIHAVVCACTTRSASPTFSYTRDGSALVIAVYYQDRRWVDYLSGQEEFDQWVKWLFDELLELKPEEQTDYLQDKF